MSARDHPVILPLRQRRQQVDDLGGTLVGQAFADERNWLSPEEREAFVQLGKDWPWIVAAQVAWEDRVRLDHPDLFEGWIREEIGLARRNKMSTAKWQTLRGRAVRYRIDEQPQTTPTALVEQGEDILWRVTEVSSGRVVFEASATDIGDPQGGERERRGIVGVRIEGDVLLTRDHEGAVVEHPLP